MSVINVMLRDLDRRQGRAPGDMSAAEAVRAVAPPSPWRLGRSAQILIALILVGGAAGAWWMQRQAVPAAVPAAAFAQVPVAQPAAVAAAMAGTEPAPKAAAALAKDSKTPAAPPAPAAPTTFAAAVPASPKAERSNVSGVPTPQQLPALAAAAPPRSTPTASAQQTPSARPAVPVPPTVLATAVVRSEAGAGIPARVLAATTPGEGKVYTPRQAAAKQVADAAVLLRQGRSDEARALLQRTLDSQPADLQARQMLVQLHLESGQLDPAQALLVEGQRLHPDQPGFAQTLARVKVEKGDVPGAIQLLEGSSRGAGRDDPQTHALLGALLLRVLRYEESVQHYLVALRADPGNTSWLVGAGVGLEAIGKTTDAAEAYRRAASAPGLTPDLAGFLNDRLVRLGATRP